MASASSPRHYHGVRKRDDGKWVTETLHPLTKQRYWLGTYSTPEKAAIAHDAAVFYFKGHCARHLNFPKMVTALPCPPTSSLEDVRMACKKASLLVETVAPNPTHIQLSPDQIQAICDAPLDCYETWMESNDKANLYLSNATSYVDDKSEHEEVPNDSLWDP